MDELKVLKEIKELRKEMGVTQDEMASKLGIDQSNYSKLEKGKSSLTRAALKKIAERLDTTPEAIIERAHQQLPGALGGYASDVSPSEYIRVSKALQESQAMNIKLMQEIDALKQKCTEESPELKKLISIFGKDFVQELLEMKPHDAQYLKDTVTGVFDPDIVFPSPPMQRENQSPLDVNNPSQTKKNKSS